MKILIICSSFPPDSGIATTRPAKFAKYLDSLGHQVVVIRSGKIFGKADNRSLDELKNISIFSFEESKTKSERDEIEQRSTGSKPLKRKEGPVTEFLRKIYHVFMDCYLFYEVRGRRTRNKIIKTYMKHEETHHCDVVISTFSPVGCLQAGKHIGKIEKCAWVADFRDLMDNMCFSALLRGVNRIVQKVYVWKADASLCVSIGNTNMLKRRNKHFSNKIFTVFNGYDKDEIVANSDSVNSKPDSPLLLCYTGTLHGGIRDLRPLFKAIAEIAPDEMSKRYFQLRYAGKEGHIVMRQAEEYGLASIVNDMGYLSKVETAQMQASCDVFLVASWNTKSDQGILTGKFYEALARRKPVVCLVAGNLANSELRQLIQKYNLGICYEEAEDTISGKELKNYILKQYERKRSGRKVEFSPSEEAFSMFHYENIVKELETILLELCDK